MSKRVVGVMGPGADAAPETLRLAFELGRLIATQGWVLLTGGRNSGVMDAASNGAKSAGGLTVGVLPSAGTDGISSAVDIAIITGMGQARNNINVLSSSIVFACGMGAGTASEIALAIKAGRKVVLLQADSASIAFFKGLGGNNVVAAQSPEEAIELARVNDGLAPRIC